MVARLGFQPLRVLDIGCAFYALTRRRGRMHTRREVAVMLTSAAYL